MLPEFSPETIALLTELFQDEVRFGTVEVRTQNIGFRVHVTFTYNNYIYESSSEFLTVNDICEKKREGYCLSMTKVHKIMSEIKQHLGFLFFSKIGLHELYRQRPSKLIPAEILEHTNMSEEAAYDYQSNKVRLYTASGTDGIEQDFAIMQTLAGGDSGKKA